MKLKSIQKLVLLSFLLFSSCGKQDTPISVDEGLALANEMKEHNKTNKTPEYLNVDYSYDTMDQSINSTSCKASYISNYIDNYCYFTRQDKINKRSEKSITKESFWSYFSNNLLTQYYENGSIKIYQNVSKNEQTYKESEQKSEYSTIYNRKISIYDCYGIDVIEIANEAISNILDTDFFMPDAYEEEIDFYSNKPGHLKLYFSYQSSDNELSGKTTYQYEFEDYYLNYYKFCNNITRRIVNGKSVTKSELTLKFNYEKRKVKSPQYDQFLKGGFNINNF